MKAASYDLTGVADQDLLSNLEVLLCRERETLAEVLAHIGEIDRRRLFAKHACSSLFEYCVSRLRMSEAAAGKRITAARLAHRFQAIVPMVARGELHLSGLNVLATHLTDENHQQLLDASRQQSKRAIEQIVADVFPKPSVPSRIRQLPSKATPLPADTTQLCLAANRGASRKETPGPCETLVVREAVGSPVPLPAARRASTQPLGTDRFKVEFTASKGLRDKLRQARELLRHVAPDGDLATIIERGIDLLLLEVKAKRFGISKRSQIKAANGARPMPQKDSGASKTRRGEKPSTHRSGIESDGKRSRSIPRDVRRQVYERDEGRCTYRDADGHRCCSRSVEFHHLEPYSLGGENTVWNLTLLCKPHNAMAAVEDFGSEWMAERIALNARNQHAPELVIDHISVTACGCPTPVGWRPVHV